MRRIYIFIAVLLVGVFAMAYLYFSNLNKESSASDFSLNAIASNASLVFTFENNKGFYDILANQTVFNEIIGEDKTKSFQSLRRYLIADPSINQFIADQKITIGFLAGNKDSIDLIIATQTNEHVDYNVLNRLRNIKITAEGDIHKLVFADSTTYFINIAGKSIFLSNTKTALRAIANNNNKSKAFTNYIKHNSNFTKNSLANIYIDFNHLPSLLNNLLANKINGELAIFNKQNSFASLSYNFSSEKLLLNGYTELFDANSYYKLFAKETEQKITIDQVLPEQTANYTAYAINDYTKWLVDLRKWQEYKNEKTKIEKESKLIDEQYGVSLDNTFPKYFKQQLATFQLKSGEKLGILEIKNGDKLGQLLLDLSTEYGTDIRIFKEKNILYNYFGQALKNFERPFYTIVDNYFVMANNASTIQSFLNSYGQNRLLVNLQDYKDFKDEIANSATILFYTNNQNASDIFRRNLKSKFYKQFRSENGLKNYNAFGYQLSSDNDKFLSNIILLKKKTIAKLDTISH